MITEDQTALIGAPGPYTWRGTVFAVSVEDDYLFRDKTHYYIPVIRGESPVDKYAYLGKKYLLRYFSTLRVPNFLVKFKISYQFLVIF